MKEASYSWRLAFSVDNIDKKSPDTMSVGKQESEGAEFEPESSCSVVWKGSQTVVLISQINILYINTLLFLPEVSRTHMPSIIHICAHHSFPSVSVAAMSCHAHL